jgi:hypothetical protein
VSAEYFNERTANRQCLLWAVATRQQLDRWEPLVAAHVAGLAELAPPLTDEAIWRAAFEHHFALVAVHHLFQALGLPGAVTISIDDTLQKELTEARHLHEHWAQNMPVFNVRPRRVEPKHPSGRSFAERNPTAGPYWWLGWNNKRGPMLSPNVAAPEVHAVLDAVERLVTTRDPALAAFVPPRAPSRWAETDGESWPVPADRGATGLGDP